VNKDKIKCERPLGSGLFLLDRSANYRWRQLALVRSRRAMKVGVKIVRAAKVVVIA